MQIFAISHFKKWYFFVPILIHFFLIVTLTAYTSQSVANTVLPTYLIFSFLFLISTLFSLNSVLKYSSGVFYYLLNIMFLLGFWFKYSMQKITSLSYREPIGNFIQTSASEKRVLEVVIWGVLGFLLAQVCTRFALKKFEISKESIKTKLANKKTFISILLLSIFLALINLKFNILVFGLEPSISIPLKGNAIFFLALTRGIIFLFFYFCFKSYSNKMVFCGALIATICSIGVLSRMIILIYFSVVFVLILQNARTWKFKRTLQNISITLLSFFLFSYLTVFLSTGLRTMYINQYSNPITQTKLQNQTQTQTSTQAQTQAQTQSKTLIQPQTQIQNQIITKSNNSIAAAKKVKYFDIKQKALAYKQLALGRWIGIEGVMAVDSYSQKGFGLLWDALKEEGYKGRSFYTKISNPPASPISPPVESLFSTSVPGPIAFFYYSGSKLFVFFAVLISTFLLSTLEYLALTLSNKQKAVGVFISTFIVFDFFQFGISPLAFVRYLSFSLVSIALFYYLIGFRNQKGIYENI